MRIIIIVFVSLLSFLSATNTQATIIHVPADSSCIQCAINGALDGDTVLVARGHYYERINFLGKAILVASNFIFDNDTTTIDSTIIDADTSVLGVSATGSVVIFASSEDSNSVIKGFTVQKGIGNTDQYGYRYGGGIYCYYASPTISNNTITRNSANARGGGVYCYRCFAAISCNTIASNTTELWGGGISCNGSSPAISNNTIIGNFAYAGGGIACLWNSSPAITNNTLADNSVSGRGGGIASEYDSSPTISYNSISTNSAVWGGGINCYDGGSSTIIYNTINDNTGGFGGGIHCDASSATISHNRITGNSATTHGWGGGINCTQCGFSTISYNIIAGNSSNTGGGGIYCFGHASRPTISYNIIIYNQTREGGGGILCEEFSSPSVTNNTIDRNSTTYYHGGGVACSQYSSPSISNNIISNSIEGEGVGCESGSDATISYNDVWNNADGNFYNCPPGVGDTTWGMNLNGTPCDSFHNISCNPTFCYPDTGNYYLADTSCCVGAGCDSLGNPDCTVDIGAFGVGCPPLLPPNPFSLLFPPNKAFMPRKVRFDWETATDPNPSDCVRYDLYISTSYHHFLDSATVDSNLVASEYMKTLNYGAYYWKVKAKDNLGAERWSNETRYFMVTGIHYSGDLNLDGTIDVADVVFLTNYIYTSGHVPEPLWVGDTNCDGIVNIADVVCLINYLFIGGPLPCGF